ncbi:MAG: folate family ECF transporter S component, partial [Oscillospiraceae bacterium]|nr:folate family ECF transporter S component [Oscillospiraceae bacterium]
MSKIRDQLRDSAAQLKSPRALALTALFIALNIAMDALNLRIQLTPDLRIGFGFLTSAMVGMLFGPVVAMTAGAATDILGWLVNTGGGAYFPGFTLTAILAGLIWGLFLYQRPLKWWRCLGAKLVINVFLNIFLNSVWMHIYYGKAMIVADLPLRIGKNLLLLPV